MSDVKHISEYLNIAFHYVQKKKRQYKYTMFVIERL